MINFKEWLKSKEINEMDANPQMTINRIGGALSTGQPGENINTLVTKLGRLPGFYKALTSNPEVLKGILSNVPQQKTVTPQTNPTTPTTPITPIR
jgi:hypothetical protein